jgi:hypothetical protein
MYINVQCVMLAAGVIRDDRRTLKGTQVMRFLGQRVQRDKRSGDGDRRKKKVSPLIPADGAMCVEDFRRWLFCVA